MEPEAEIAVEEQPAKKGRHRKKLLYSSIVQQMEFYFSDSNLSKDRYFSKLVKDDPQIDLNVFLQFNNMKKLTTNLDDIIKALSKSEILGLSEDETKVFRKTPIKIKTNIDECTIYVEHIKSDTSHEWVSSVFSEFGKVVYVSLPKYKHNKLNKGFAFVEFEQPQEAQKALEYFENIGCKMSSHMEPDKLCSISAYCEKEEGKCETMKADSTQKEPEEKQKIDTDEEFASSDVKKRKHRDSETENHDKKKVKRKKSVNFEEEKPVNVDENKEKKENKEGQDNSGAEETEDKKKKKHKKLQKRKAYFKELGLQILSKDEWKKMRNRYLTNQRNKMKQLKAHLNKRRHQMFDDKMKNEVNSEEMADVAPGSPEDGKKLEFVPGVIVKAKLKEPCYDIKKTKAEIKTCSSDIQYIDIPLPSGSEEIFIRFSDGENALQFLNSNFNGDLCLLEGDEEAQYWEKIKTDRNVKMKKEKKKQRGREKLLKRAERELGKHIRFDEAE